jgi:hypothetical protein
MNEMVESAVVWLSDGVFQVERVIEDVLQRLDLFSDARCHPADILLVRIIGLEFPRAVPLC